MSTTAQIIPFTRKPNNDRLFVVPEREPTNPDNIYPISSRMAFDSRSSNLAEVHSFTAMNPDRSNLISMMTTQRGTQITLMGDGVHVDIQLDHADMVELYHRIRRTMLSARLIVA